MSVSLINDIINRPIKGAIKYLSEFTDTFLREMKFGHTARYV